MKNFRLARLVAFAVLILTIGGCLVGYRIWEPGKKFTDGRHDRGQNGIWMQHGWLGDNKWFKRYGRDPSLFRDRTRITKLKKTLATHNFTDLYPHLCPCDKSGTIPQVDPAQTRLFLLVMNDRRVMPWVGGVLGRHVFLESEKWRENFIGSIIRLMTAYPSFSGVHVNIEPMPSGNKDFLTLLRDLKKAMPDGKILSIAAYPPPALHRLSPKVHWGKEYYGSVAGEVDQMAVMMYDTALPLQKLYRSLMASWTGRILSWSPKTDVLLGVPAYDDHGVDYHDPEVENIENGLSGIHAGLAEHLPENYKGIAVYSEWEMDGEEWKYLKKGYCK